MAQIVIKKVTKFNKCAKVEHDGGSLMFWLSDAFADDLTEGATVNVSAEDKPNKDGTGTDKWIKTVNGKEAKAKGGGGRAYQPKPREETHGPCISGIIKECIAQGDIELVLATKAIEMYKASVKEYAP